MKVFNNEIEKLYHRLKSKTHFSFSKFADGEWLMMRGIPINNGEFNYTQDDSFFRDRLIESFQYKDSGYYVGVSCPCCVGDDHINMINFSGQNDTQLTFANIFVNANYTFYKEHFIKEYSKWQVHLIANSRSRIENLPFNIEKFYAVENTAWRHNYNLIEDLKKANLNNKLLLFACGPFGNMLAHQLWEHNKNNTYLDIGSTLNPWLQSEGFKRDYYDIGIMYKNRICSWGR